MIKPTVGRVVWFTPSTTFTRPDFLIIDQAQPCAALVSYVWGDRMVNLTVSDHYGNTSNATSVALLQDDDARPESGYFCEWMPYQVGQAKAAGGGLGSGAVNTAAVGTGAIERNVVGPA